MQYTIDPHKNCKLLSKWKSIQLIPLAKAFNLTLSTALMTPNIAQKKKHRKQAFGYRIQTFVQLGTVLEHILYSYENFLRKT